MEKIGIDHTKRVLEEIEEIGVKLVSVSKSGVGLSSARTILSMGDDIKTLAIEAKHSFPEIKDIDKDEAKELAFACLEMVKNIVFSLAE